MEAKEALDLGETNKAEGRSPCVVMFSGGRDSTLAALRIHELGHTPTLVTITSSHLTGIESVKKRVQELAEILPADTRWLHVRQPTNLFSDQSFYYRTCLPCQQAYVVVAAKVAHMIGCHQIAMGYAAYQGTWPEQTRLATERLQRTLAQASIRLLLPVYEIASKDEAIATLEKCGLSTSALEQKCLRQVTNVELSQAHLEEQISGWERAIAASLERLIDIDLQIFSDVAIKDVQ